MYHIAWRAELLEILSVFDVRSCQLTIPTISQPPQGGALEASEIKQRAEVRQRRTFSACFRNGALLLFIPALRSLLTVCST